jgi:arylsulfatase A-like enzyme
LTGRHPVRLNITDWLPGLDSDDRKLKTPEDLHQLPHSEVTLAESLKEKGYQTWFIGKWHLGDSGYYPEDQGFDVNLGGYHAGHPHNGYYAPFKNPMLEDSEDGEYLPDRLTDEAINLIKSRGERSFFLMLSYYTVHTPIQPCKRYIAKYIKKRADLAFEHPDSTIDEHEGHIRLYQANPAYASMVEAMDQNVGRLLSTLEEEQISEDTKIILTSDNGGLSTFYEWRGVPPTALRPLRAGKGWCYEGGIRIPLIIHNPDYDGMPKTVDEPVISMDIYPTVLELCGYNPKGDHPIDGISLKTIMQDDSQLNRKFLTWHYPHYHGSSWTPGSAIRRGKWKLIKFYHWEKTELYNLERDLSESNNVYSSYPNVAAELDSFLSSSINEMGGKYPVAH